MKKIPIIASLILVAGIGCYDRIHSAQSDSSVWFAKPTPYVNAKLPAAKDILREWRFTAHSTAQPGEPQGTVFEWHSDDQSLRCSAGFVYGVGTRLLTNQNQLEFWCRGAKDSAPLQFKKIPRPRDFAQSYIGNVNGKLYNYAVLRVYDFVKQKWKELSKVDGKAVGGTAPYIFLSYGEKNYVASNKYAHCRGVSLFSDDGYYGTIDSSEHIGAISLWRGHIYLNSDAQIWRAPLPTQPLPIDRTCHILKHSVVDRGPDRVYAFFPHKDALYYGGSVVFDRPDTERGHCAAVRKLTEEGMRRGEKPKTILPRLKNAACDGERITEHYTFVPYFDDVLIGNFPFGTLSLLHNDTLVESPFAAPDADSFHDTKGVYYRESQSLTNSYGEIFVGMYPWARLYEIDAHSHVQQEQRLMKQPQRVAASMAPYYAEDPLHPQLATAQWAQRIANIAVFNGRLCAGSANKSGAAYSVEQFPIVPKKEAESYGSVFCAVLPNQTLSDESPKAEGELRFLITQDALYTVMNGKIIAKSPASLTPGQHKALADSEGSLNAGKGVYGRFMGTIHPTAN